MNLDVLRSRYKNLPTPVRTAIAQIVSFLPPHLKYGGTFQSVYQEICRSGMDASFAEKKTIEYFSIIYEKSLRCSEFYSTYPQLGELKNFSDLREFVEKLPILSRDELADNIELFLTEKKESLDFISTSGSSGKPLNFYLDRDRSVTEWAFLHAAWKKVGFTHRRVRAVFRGVSIANVDKQPYEYDAGLRELRISVFHLNEKHFPDFLDQMKKRSVTFLHGYPSAITILSQYLLDNPDRQFQNSIEGVLLTSEATYSIQRDIIRETFPGARIQSFYGLSEKVAFASETGLSDVFEFSPLYGYVELVDQHGVPVHEIGKEGRIIASGLRFSAMPLMRYDTGDYATLIELPCEKNNFKLKVQGITPRRGQEFILGCDGRKISIAAVNIHSKAYGALRQFQLFQDKLGEVEVRVVLAPNKTLKDAKEFVSELSTKVGTSVLFTLKVVERFPASRGKHKLVEQLVPII